ncbi:hypothetical protein CONLIGDRAFT_687829 [Coniochaeta ligniaria NRRL 30616]|uniref:Uncharacterized protein n=1 Tax=Coniochaeta ligniaria NRRL 30616 TaxID=1408157 RepID=A0A1J7ILY5_9PEZI|nr:hypothetical protein CONLIGDRAFT_687829 [Coniochaeta ligniaria NRRL 30616]
MRHDRSSDTLLSPETVCLTPFFFLHDKRAHYLRRIFPGRLRKWRSVSSSLSWAAANKTMQQSWLHSDALPSALPRQTCTPEKYLRTYYSRFSVSLRDPCTSCISAIITLTSTATLSTALDWESWSPAEDIIQPPTGRAMHQKSQGAQTDF